MADFTDIVLFLSSGRTIAWVGAGPSVELGLPTWKGLASTVLEECRRQKNNRFTRIERFYKEGKYLAQFDEVVIGYGRDFLHDICHTAVADPGGQGGIYTEISNLDFLSYFTTNYDDVLGRHLEDAGKAVVKYTNTQEDLEAIDIDVIPALVKLHGDFSDPKSVILTGSDYRHHYDAGDREGFQTFVRSHLLLSRILFIGYSLDDPDVLALQRRVAANIRRKVAPIGIMANVSEEDVQHWMDAYNIDVLSYPASNSDHSALQSLLKSVSDVLAIGSFAQSRRTDSDIRQIQALYMWHRFSPSVAGDAPVDALQSLMMSTLVNVGRNVTRHDLGELLENAIGASVDSDSNEFTRAVDLLIAADWIIEVGDVLQIQLKGRSLVDRYERQFSDLIDVFTRQLSLDLRKAFDVEDHMVPRLAQVALDSLIDLFELRGRNIMEMVFDSNPFDPRGITDILQTLWKRVNTLDDQASRAPLVSFLLNLLANPSGVYENVLDYLAKSFFCIQAMRLDPAVTTHVSEVVADRTLVIDDNILIPLTAKDEDRYEFMSATIQSARDSNINLCTTERFVQTVRRHADWALDLVNEYGTQSLEVMRAASGDGGYLPNAFLKGYVSQEPLDQDRDFLQYLQDCFGGSYRRDRFDSYFENELGIRILNSTQLSAFIQSKQDLYTKSSLLMTGWNQSRTEDHRKSLTRIESEIEAMLLVTHWTDAGNIVDDLSDAAGAFLTSGSSVPRLARSLESVSGPMMVVSPEAIWELLAHLSPSRSEGPSFRSMMMSSHFRLAQHFVEPANYRHFFGPLIAAAKSEFNESREIFEAILGLDLGVEFLEEFDEEDWPTIVSRLGNAVARQTSERSHDREELIDENAKLRSMIESLQTRERRRREYVARQRERSKSRRGRKS